MESPEHLHPIPKDFEDTPFTEKMVLAQAIEELIIEKKITSSHEIRHQVDLIDSRSPMLGAELIAHGWLDSKFKEKLLINLNEAAKEIGIDTGTIPIRAIENTEKIHNLIVCTLCSCYPRMILGLPPDWYKSREYRSRAVREPRKVLLEFGTNIPKNVEVCVHDSTADLRYIVIPKRPPETIDWSFSQLTQIITRDSMIGVDIPKILLSPHGQI